MLSFVAAKSAVLLIAVAAAGVPVGIGGECIAARDRIEEIHGAVHVDCARGIGPFQLSATDRIGGRCQLDLIAASETDPSIVQRFSHACHLPILVTDLVDAKRLLILAHA